MLEPKCAICREPATAIAVEQLRADGLSLSEIEARVKRSRSSVDRHLKHAAKKPGSHGARASSRTSFQTGRRPSKRASDGRCPTCGLLAEGTDHATTLRRLERVVWICETEAHAAQESHDSRLAILASKEARAALDTLARSTGLIGDGGVNVNIVQAEVKSLQQAITIVVDSIEGKAKQDEFLRLWMAFEAGETYELPTTIDQPPALPPPSDEAA